MNKLYIGKENFLYNIIGFSDNKNKYNGTNKEHKKYIYCRID